MNEHLCGCGRPAPDATICVACGYDLDAALGEITAYHGLGWDLDIAVSRSTDPKMTAQEILEEKRAPGVLAPMRLPYNPRASIAADALKNTLSGWARVIDGEQNPRPYGPTCRHCVHGSCTAIRRPGLPPDTITGIAAWLRPRVGWLRHHPAGREACDAILAAVHQARRVCDRPAEKLYAGVCDCGAHLYARPGSLTIVCRDQAHDEPVVWPVEDRRVQLLAALDDHLANSQQMARLISYLGITLPDSTIRWWAGKGRIVAHGHKDGCPLYRLGDVVRTYLQASNKAS